MLKDTTDGATNGVVLNMLKDTTDGATKNVKLTIRLKKESYATIQGNSTKNGYSTVSSYARELLLAEKLSFFSKNDEMLLITLSKNLSKIGVNINQIAKASNSKKFFDHKEEIEKSYLSTIKDISDCLILLRKTIENANNDHHLKV